MSYTKKYKYIYCCKVSIVIITWLALLPSLRPLLLVCATSRSASRTFRRQVGGLLLSNPCSLLDEPISTLLVKSRTVPSAMAILMNVLAQCKLHTSDDEC